MKSEFLWAPVAPLLIPVPPQPDQTDPDDPPADPILTSYRDEPRLMSNNQWAGFLKVISVKSRSIHQEPLTEADNAELARLFGPSR